MAIAIAGLAIAFAGLNISAADFNYLGRVRYFPYVANRPLRVASQPEKREYYAILVSHDQPYGNPSASITVTVSA